MVSFIGGNDRSTLEGVLEEVEHELAAARAGIRDSKTRRLRDYHDGARAVLERLRFSLNQAIPAGSLAAFEAKLDARRVPVPITDEAARLVGYAVLDGAGFPLVEASACTQCGKFPRDPESPYQCCTACTADFDQEGRCDETCVSCNAGDHDECGVGCHDEDDPEVVAEQADIMREAMQCTREGCTNPRSPLSVDGTRCLDCQTDAFRYLGSSS